jgi:hypothetical protein
MTATMNPPHTIAHYRITVELAFASSEEGNVLSDQQRCVELRYLFGVAREAWGA